MAKKLTVLEKRKRDVDRHREKQEKAASDGRKAQLKQDKEQLGKYEIESYTLPTASPWLAEINGHLIPCQSLVARLLLHLADKAKAPRKKKAPSKKKVETAA